MNTAAGKIRIYIVAFATIFVWSSTFISTKILLKEFSPVEILLYRFFAAWLLMFIVYPKVHRPESLKAELTLVLAGISGGSLYFLGENFALRFSLASNVSLLVSTAPILTAILAHFFIRGEKFSRNSISGALIAFAGAALVILNGTFVLKLNPAGDLLALSSALSWAVYSITIKNLKTKYPTYYITRKIFFYTLLTSLPVVIVSPIRLQFSAFADPVMAVNFLFLAVFASCGAYVAWNRVIWTLGATKANNFIYFIPLLTLFESALILGEPLTPFAGVGTILVVAGVFQASKKTEHS
ncbi:DMT family transporter [Treponema zuelzerae]|uniref:DMT family transporter n=1 Tax=Teretinema zuelzerae TaxID=156 RepID=A0AAE3EJF9_9SPIR|nr:DMT family transporter [Teretinema zuelzerae]MCD1656135.1 DMT family transporter [Teretinema zuelzerae]